MALPQSISEEFGMSAEGADVYADSAMDAANDPLMDSTVKPDLLQTIQPQVVADPNQSSANDAQMTAKQQQAVKQYQDLTTKTPSGMGAALSAGAGAQAGQARQETAQKAATQMASKAADLQKVISGADAAKPKEAGLGGKVTGAVIGQGFNVAAAGLATVVAGPAAGAAVAAVGMTYDVVKVFSGQSDGPSSFGTRDSKGEVSAFTTSSSAQPAASAPAQPATTAFNNFMSNIPGVGAMPSMDQGQVETTSAALKGIEKAPKLSMTPAAAALQGIFRNGQEAAASKDGPAVDQDEKLDFKAAMPNPGVFQPAAPKPFFG